MKYNTIIIIGNILNERKEKVKENLEISKRKLDELYKEEENAELSGESFDFTDMEVWKEIRRKDLIEFESLQNAIDDFYNHDFR